ncbi:hypothetical protein LIER_15593 [Lithospermum erythrorhizon]|uniref:Uncharacterized protein n=1 Tax=Lithospermum erythrorhizon TaxID=34254 RepID=A0AAV3Q5F4_LITER
MYISKNKVCIEEERDVSTSLATDWISNDENSPLLADPSVFRRLIGRYLKGTAGCGLFYLADSDTTLQAFCDVDWAKCTTTRRSITGYCAFLG